MGSLWQRDRYLNPGINILIDKRIREFDMSKANISVLARDGYLSQNDYNRLLVTDKQIREKEIGIWQLRDGRISKALSDGFASSRKAFLEINGIDDVDILSVKKDAIMVIGDKVVTCTQIDPFVSFRCTEYSSFYKLDRKELYYYFNQFKQEEILDIKGIGKSTYLHEPYMTDFLKELFQTAQMLGCNEAITLLSMFYNKYCKLELPVGYYREYNANSLYFIKRFANGQIANFYSDIADDSYKPFVDISYNAHMLMQLSRIYSTAYFNK